MTRRKGTPASRIRLAAERRAELLEARGRHFAAEFDEPLSAFRAEGLLDFFLRELGPAVYNQGVQDMVATLQAKLADVDAEVCEPEG